jgi:hypothetical protein
MCIKINNGKNNFMVTRTPHSRDKKVLPAGIYLVRWAEIICTKKNEYIYVLLGSDGYASVGLDSLWCKQIRCRTHIFCIIANIILYLYRYPLTHPKRIWPYG